MPRLKKNSSESKRRYQTSWRRKTRSDQAQEKVEMEKKTHARQMNLRRQVESPIVREERRKKKKIHMMMKRQGESPTVQQTRRMKNKILMKIKRQGESLTAQQTRRSKNKVNMNIKRKMENAKVRRIRLVKEAKAKAYRRLTFSSHTIRCQLASEQSAAQVNVKNPIQDKTCAPCPHSASDEYLETFFERNMANLNWHSCSNCYKTSLSFNAKVCSGRCAHFSASNNMDPGPVPPELSDLSYLEQQLIARVHPVVSVYRIKGHQLGYSGHVINFPQTITKFTSTLPHRITDVSAVIAVRKGGDAGNLRDFYVRAARVRDALVWLKNNNSFYKDVVISEANLASLPQDGCASHQVPRYVDEQETSKDDMPDDEGNQVQVSGVPMMRPPHQNQQVVAVLDWPPICNQPVDEFHTAGYIAQAFPALFPTGAADLNSPREHSISPMEYFKHLLMYEDHRFANDPRFRFFAFNTLMRWSALKCGNLFVRRNEELHGRSVKELRQMIAANPDLAKRIMFYGTKLRGTKPYWRARLGELLDMERQLGLPTLFMTISAADLHWPDLYHLMVSEGLIPEEDEELHNNLHTLTEEDRRNLLASNPLTPSLFFFERAELFLRKILHKKLGVTDFWHRYEWQHRGSPHVHMLLWLPNAPDVTRLPDMTDEEKADVVRYYDNLVKTVNPGLNVPPAEVHPCRKLLMQVEDREKDLAELVNKVQRHTRCSLAHCLRKNKKTGHVECRYKFPFDLSDTSLLRQSDKGTFELVTERNDTLVNKFHPWVLQLWRANMDISPVLSKDAFLNYIAKYASKAEVKSKTMSEMVEGTLNAMTDLEPAKKAVQKILVQTCSDRDFSSQEVLHLALGKKLQSASSAFVKIVFYKTEWVRVHDCTALSMNNDDCEPIDAETEGSGSTLIEKYCRRPKCMETVTLWEAASAYTPKKQGPWSQRRTRAVVSAFPRRKLTTDDEKNEEFFRQQVLRHVPWRDEDSVKLGFSTWRKVVHHYSLQSEEASTTLPPLPEEEYEEHPDEDHNTAKEEWMVVAGAGPNGEMQRVEPGLREVDLRHQWPTLRDDPACLRTLINEVKEQAVLQSHDRGPRKTVQLTPQQNQVMEILEDQLAEKCGVQLVLVQGKAGCGKSTLIHAITVRLTEALGSDSYLLLAPTGSAALNIDGNTVHAALNIPIKTRDFQPLDGAAARSFHDLMENVRVVIIDEYSMIGLPLLGMIEQRCADAKSRNSEKLFGGLNIYLFGDIRQLPPVGSKPLYSAKAQTDMELRGAYVFRQFNRIVVLTESMRQSDEVFREVLDDLSKGICSDKSFFTLSSRFRTNVTPEEITTFAGAPHLFTEGKLAFSYNLEQLLHLHRPISRIPAKNNCDSAKEASVDEAGGLEPVVYLAVGSRVVLKANLCVKVGLVNGALGTVVQIFYNLGQSQPDDLPAAVMVHFDKYSGPCWEQDVFPILPITRMWMKGSTSCSRTQVPLLLSWGTTVHQAQGQTFEKVVVNVGSKEFQAGLSYVALSRCRRLEDLLVDPEFSRDRLNKLQHMKSLQDCGGLS